MCGQRKNMFDLSLLRLILISLMNLVCGSISVIDYQNQVKLDVFSPIYNFKQNECSTATKPKYTFALPPRPSQNGEEDFRCQQSVKMPIFTDGPQISYKNSLFSTNIGSSCHWMSRCCLTTSDEFLL